MFCIAYSILIGICKPDASCSRQGQKLTERLLATNRSIVPDTQTAYVKVRSPLVDS